MHFDDMLLYRHSLIALGFASSKKTVRLDRTRCRFSEHAEPTTAIPTRHWILILGFRKLLHVVDNEAYK